ncbi:hypothetical protein KIS4809_3471 [Bacillus sp. ZZV12-4809]|nr:hypothetical protein KIS4809_3471 [Bacillus sp. ZZV12-4809]
MLFVCKNHVKHAVNMLKTPHVSYNSIYIKCLFCNAESLYKIFYYDIDISRRNRTIYKNVKHLRQLTKSGGEI